MDELSQGRNSLARKFHLDGEILFDFLSVVQMQIHARFSRLGGRGRKHGEPFRNDMAFRQSEDGRVGEQQVIFILVQRLRQSSRSIKREMRAAKDVLVSLSDDALYPPNP